ncbi:RPA-interacting protein [Nomia melanderi]|uniref:RPA-interacting protein n=1 Tax=Nomia melanderi TaxID=2448451 RepID=UPI001304754C|nr:RPA-interacting protein-like [Nomia melanderi]
MIECTKDTENVTLSPTTSLKLKTRENVNKIRHGSPKLQEVLRERCRQRMREKRGQLFCRSRFGLEINPKDMEDTLTEIVRKELITVALTDVDPAVNPFFHVINEPLDPEEALELENEILNEEKHWILEEYERMTQEELEFLALTADEKINDVLCPLCQRSNLIEEGRQVGCKSCTLKLNNVSLKDLGNLINNSVNSHSAMCTERPGFILIEDNNVCLYLFCDKCSALILLA